MLKQRKPTELGPKQPSPASAKSNLGRDPRRASPSAIVESLMSEYFATPAKGEEAKPDRAGAFS